MAMKFQREATSDFAITAYTKTSVTVGSVEFSQSVCISHHAAPTLWPVQQFAEITSETIAHAANVGAEIVIIGTGKSLRFPKPESMRALMDARIGYEVMDTAAACRTYNVLLAEGRQVAALLLIER
jgi:uncharacterized protein